MHKNNNDKFLDKIVKKDYNNKLEKVLEKKYFNENVKNILLNILYKVEMAYKDYEKVKQNVDSKEKIIDNFISKIENNCETIKLVQPNSEESKIIGNKTFLVEKNKKRIICYPIERKLLYCISKISKKEKIVKNQYFLINKTLSDMINIGNNINSVEVIRDFNGYSWTTIPREIESIIHNLVYQNLIILVGNDFLNKWIYNRESIIDYIELLKEKLKKDYGKNNSEEILDTLYKLSILLDFRYDKKVKEQIIKIKNEVDKQYVKILDSKNFIREITQEKINLSKKIKYIDETINNQEMLQQEYITRNEKLQLKDKIFSVRILSNIMEEERTIYINRIEELNNLLNPNNYINYRKELKEKEKYLQVLNNKNIDEQIEQYIILLQNQFLKCYEEKIKTIDAKQDMINLIYEFRYYCMIPYDSNKYIYEVKSLEKDLIDLQMKIIKKACELKVINIFSENELLNFEIIKNIFYLRNINLESLNISIIKEKDDFFVQIFDEKVFEEKNKIKTNENINKKDFQMKLNKKIKIFC